MLASPPRLAQKLTAPADFRGKNSFGTPCLVDFQEVYPFYPKKVERKQLEKWQHKHTV